MLHLRRLLGLLTLKHLEEADAPHPRRDGRVFASLALRRGRGRERDASLVPVARRSVPFVVFGGGRANHHGSKRVERRRGDAFHDGANAVEGHPGCPRDGLVRARGVAVLALDPSHRARDARLDGLAVRQEIRSRGTIGHRAAQRAHEVQVRGSHRSRGIAVIRERRAAFERVAEGRHVGKGEVEDAREVQQGEDATRRLLHREGRVSLASAREGGSVRGGIRRGFGGFFGASAASAASSAGFLAALGLFAALGLRGGGGGFAGGFPGGFAGGFAGGALGGHLLRLGRLLLLVLGDGGGAFLVDGGGDLLGEARELVEHDEGLRLAGDELLLLLVDLAAVRALLLGVLDLLQALLDGAQATVHHELDGAHGGREGLPGGGGGGIGHRGGVEVGSRRRSEAATRRSRDLLTRICFAARVRVAECGYWCRRV